MTRGQRHPEDKPQTQEKHKTEKGKWGRPNPADSVLGLLSTWQGEGGPLRGRWGLSPLFSLLFKLFLSPFLTQKHTQNPIFQVLSHRHIHDYSVSLPLSLFLSLSLGSPILPPPPLICSGICGDASLALPTRDAKNGDTTSGQMTWPRPRPPPSPSRRLYYLICSSS